MRCEDVERLLSGQTLAELPGVENAAVGAHLASCPACREKWGLDGQSQEFHEAIRALRPREGAEHSLLAKLDAEEGAVEPKPAPPQSEMPKQIGGFQLLELLGRGGMGSVYKARQVSLGRLVALKVIASRLAADERFLARFVREARAAAAVHHPNIVAVYSVGEDNGQHYIAMELVAGEGLDALVKRGGPLPQDHALELMKQTTAALAVAHEAGIIHRDIKPSNILLAADGSVKVADFGLAKRIQIDVKITATGTTVGTPLYMAPEAAGAKDLDARADLYSLGATFYHVLAGRPPFEGKTPVEVIVKHATEEPQPLAAAAPHLDPRLCRVIDRLLRKDPAERYPSAQALLGELEALGELGSPAAQEDAPKLPGDASTLPLAEGKRLAPRAAVERLQHDRGRPSTRRLLLAAAGVAVALLAALTLPRLFRPSSAPSKTAVAAPVREHTAQDPLGDPRAVALRAQSTATLKGAPSEPQADDPNWTDWEDLFDGKTLGRWSQQFAGGGRVHVEDGEIRIEAGRPFAGIVLREALPGSGWEIAFEAKRTVGTKDISSVNFSVGPSTCSLVVGGFDGSLVGLQEVDGQSLDRSPMCKRLSFETNRWYRVRLRVTRAKIQAWIEEEQVADLPVAGHTFKSYEIFRPLLSVYTYETSSALRSIRLRRLKQEEGAPPVPLPGKPGEWESLFDGRTLKGWRVVKEFPGAGPGGKVRVEDGRIVLGPGQPMTAVAWNGEFPASDYEARFQAMRVAGEQDFASVVLPIGPASCALALGGYGGTVVGVVFVDGRQGNENPTTAHFTFEKGRWYSFLVKVTRARIEGWIGEQKVVDLTRADHGFSGDSTKIHMRPFGFYSHETTGAVRDIQVRECRAGGFKGIGVGDEPRAATTVSFTSPSEARGLWPTCEGDGLFVEGERDGKAVLHQQEGKPGHGYLYFWAAEAFAEQFRTDANKTAFLSITLLDTAPGLVGVDYDSHAQLPNTDGGRWTRTGRQRLGGTGQWIEIRFPLPRARFGHRQNYGADFRISHDGDLLVHRIAVASKDERAEEKRAQEAK